MKGDRPDEGIGQSATPPAPPPPGSPAAPDQTKSSDYRKKALAQAVATKVAQGNRVESQADYQAVLVRGKKPNHTLHLILTIITLGTWGLVWIVVAILQKEHRTIIQVDEYGNTLVQEVT